MFYGVMSNPTWPHGNPCISNGSSAHSQEAQIIQSSPQIPHLGKSVRNVLEAQPAVTEQQEQEKDTPNPGPRGVQGQQSATGQHLQRKGAQPPAARGVT